MIGSVFSPYYAWSGRHVPENHIALNVGLYGNGKKRWTMTERGKADLEQTQHSLRIGPSSLVWDGDCLTIRIDEWANPVFRKVRGEIRLYPEALIDQPYMLDGKNRHAWQPLAPVCKTEVRFQNPQLHWSGSAYVDSNWGIEPLEKGFRNWDWSRAHTPKGAAILYDAFSRDGTNRRLFLEIDRKGTVTEKSAETFSRHDLKKGPIWRVKRSTLAPAKDRPATIKMLEDTPFYTRSYIRSAFAGDPVIAVHESLDCDRFASNWVRCLLPFRMPRSASK